MGLRSNRYAKPNANCDGDCHANSYSAAESYAYPNNDTNAYSHSHGDYNTDSYG